MVLSLLLLLTRFHNDREPLTRYIVVIDTYIYLDVKYNDSEMHARCVD